MALTLTSTYNEPQKPYVLLPRQFVQDASLNTGLAYRKIHIHYIYKHMCMSHTYIYGIYMCRYVPSTSSLNLNVLKSQY